MANPLSRPAPGSHPRVFRPNMTNRQSRCSISWAAINRITTLRRADKFLWLQSCRRLENQLVGVGPRVLTCKGGEGGCEAVIVGSTSPRDRQSLDVLCV